MIFTKHSNVKGQDAKEIPCITGSGAPTVSTEGAVGVLYMDSNTGEIYKCTEVADGVYTWKALVESGDGKLYKHALVINCSDYNSAPYATLYSSFVSMSSKPITTLEELVASPAVGGGSHLNVVTGYFFTQDDPEHEYPLWRVTVGARYGVEINYITAYTVPLTTSYKAFNASVVTITDTVTEI